MTTPHASTVRSSRIPRPEREQQILDVAAAEIDRVGFAALSLAEVAERAGVSKPLVYSYFSTKDGLYIACVRRAGANLIAHIDEAIAISGPTPTAAAQRTLTAIFTALQPRPHDWTVIFDPTLPASGPAMDAARTVRRTLREQAATGAVSAVGAIRLDDPLDLSALIDMWMGMVTALVRWWLRHPDQTPHQMAQRFQRTLLALTETAN